MEIKIVIEPITAKQKAQLDVERGSKCSINITGNPNLGDDILDVIQKFAKKNGYRIDYRSKA